MQRLFDILPIQKLTCTETLGGPIATRLSRSGPMNGPGAAHERPMGSPWAAHGQPMSYRPTVSLSRLDPLVKICSALLLLFFFLLFLLEPNAGNTLGKTPGCGPKNGREVGLRVGIPSSWHAKKQSCCATRGTSHRCACSDSALGNSGASFSLRSLQNRFKVYRSQHEADHHQWRAS